MVVLDILVESELLEFLKLGLFIESSPLTELSLKVKFVLTLIPAPRSLFCFIPKPKVFPLVPKPAPAEISPVAFSSTSISTIFKFGLDPSKILESTFSKIPLARILFKDLLCKISLKASPSSTNKEFLITFSLVTEFPIILIFST